VTVQYTTADDTAVAPDDYTATTGTVVFAIGEVTKTFDVSLVNDFMSEPTEYVKVQLSNPINATLDPAKANANFAILDDDGMPPTVEFASSSYTVNERPALTWAAIEVKLSREWANSVNVDFKTADGAALAGSDYVEVTGTLTFAPGEISQIVEVAILNDAILEGTESFTATLSNPVNATLGSLTMTTVVILDNEPVLPTVQFDLLDYRIVEGAVTVNVSVSISAASGEEVKVDYETSDASAKAGEDYLAGSGTLVFAPGVAQLEIPITILSDQAPSEGFGTPPTEYFLVTLKNPQKATLGGLTVCTIYIVDDDTQPAVGFDTGTYTVTEDVGAAEMIVRLDGPYTQTVTVKYATTSSGSATPGVDYSPTSGTLTFAPGEREKSFLITIHENADEEPDETVTVELSDPVNAVLGLSLATITIQDAQAKPPNRTGLVYVVTLKGGHKVIGDWRGSTGTPSKAEDIIFKDGPHWFDYDLDGKITYTPGPENKHPLQKDFRWPTAFRRNTKMKVSAIVDIKPGTQQKVKLRATGPDGVTIAETDAFTGGSKGERHAVVDVESSALPDQVKLYDSMTLTWEFRDPKTFTWKPAGKSEHQIYVTLADPDSSVKGYQTLFHVGCKNASGQTTEAGTFSTIWDDFTDQKVTTHDKVALFYWKNKDAPDDAITAGKLILYKNGQCGSWAYFLADTVKVQGLAGVQIVEITSTYQNHALAQAQFGKYGALLVKNWSGFDAKGTAPAGVAPFTHRAKEIKDETGIKGQGPEPDPYAMFGNHFVVQYGTKYYDAAYGKGDFGPAGTDAGKQAWENAALEGFTCWFPEGGFNRPFSKKNDPNVLETVFVPFDPK
jgi:hypothetical protein